MYVSPRNLFDKKKNPCDCIVSTRNIDTAFTLQSQYQLSRKYIKYCLAPPNVISPIIYIYSDSTFTINKLTLQ